MQPREPVEDAGADERADAERGVRRVLHDLGHREAPRARRRGGLHGVQEHRDSELHGGGPVFVERKLAEVRPLDVGRGDGADGAELRDRELELAGRARGVGEIA